MNLKVLFFLLIFYGALFTVFGVVELADNPYLLDGATVTSTPVNGSALTGDETETGGFFTVGISLARFFALATLGIGLPAAVPVWFSLMIIFIVNIINMFTIGFIVDAIWSG